MNKKGLSIGEIFVIAILAILVFFLVTYYIIPKISDLLKTGSSFWQRGANDINKDINMGENNVDSEHQLSGEVYSPLTIKMEDTIFDKKPTSPSHCLVGTVIKNTGQEAWAESDNIKVALICRDVKNGPWLIQRYPVIEEHITGLKPGEEKEVFFADRYPNNCIESNDNYNIIIYSNCIGRGTEFQPCDNSPTILDKIVFNCKIG